MTSLSLHQECEPYYWQRVLDLAADSKVAAQLEKCIICDKMLIRLWTGKKAYVALWTAYHAEILL
jgi:hypothetical protein